MKGQEKENRSFYLWATGHAGIEKALQEREEKEGKNETERMGGPYPCEECMTGMLYYDVRVAAWRCGECGNVMTTQNIYETWT